jgi:O-antigen/teichoic acid export membrane protein
MSRTKDLLKNTTIVLLGTISSKIISVIMLPFYTKYLSVSEYGATDSIIIYVTFFLGIASLSIGEAFFVFPKGKSFSEQIKIFTSGAVFTVIVFGIVFLVLISCLSISLALNINSCLIDYFWYFAILLYVISIQNILQQFAKGIDRINVYSISSLVLTGLTAILGLLLIPTYGIQGFFLSLIIANIVTIFYLLIHLKAFTFFDIKLVDFEVYRKLIKYSLPLVPNTIMWWVISSINRPFLENYTGLEAVGLLAISIKLPTIITTIFSGVTTSWQVSVLEEFDKKGYRTYYAKVKLYSFIILGLISGIIIFYRTDLILIISDERYAEAANYLPILTLSSLISSMSNLVSANFLAVRKSKYYFYSSFFGASSAVFLNMWLVPWGGLWGASMAILFSNIIMYLAKEIYAYKILKTIE